MILLRARLTALLGALALAACEAPVTPPAPVRQPAPRPPVVKPAEPVKPSEESLALAAYFSRVEQSLLTQGLLRTDGGGPDTPFDARQLARTFIDIAFYEEYAPVGGNFVPRKTESRLHRWTQPVEVEVTFGASVPQAQRARDRNALAAYAGRLSRATSHPVRFVEAGGNFHVFIVNEDERRALGPRIRTLAPRISDSAVSAVTDLPRTSYCLVFAIDPGDNGVYRTAVAIIRAEHPPLLRLSCIHEELAQGMGLANDSPSARPSVFNDDEEFGLLTSQDELMLRMLYDPRLQPGMREAEARPIVELIANELMTGG